MIKGVEMGAWAYGWGLKENNRIVPRNNRKADVLHHPIDFFEVLKGLLWSTGMQNEKGRI
jgi:hypothetical protein